MKKNIFLLFLLVSTFSAMSENKSPFLELVKHYFDYHHVFNEVDYIRSFVGDSVYFDTQAGFPLSNVLIESPDTVWIKEKRPKKPKKGKDYLLCYNYCGVRKDNKTFYTPAEAFNGKKFGLFAVKEIKDSTEYFVPEKVGFDITLVEPKSAKLVHVILDKSIRSSWRLYSLNTNYKIKSWLNQSFYGRDAYDLRSKFTQYKLTFGEFYLEISPWEITSSYNSLRCYPHAQFILSTDKNGSLNLSYDSNSRLSFQFDSMEFLTADEYEAANKIYHINYEFPTDSTYRSKIRHLPFKFLKGTVDGFLSSDNKISQTIEPGYFPLQSKDNLLDSKSLSYETDIYIGDKITVRGNDYYKAVLNGKAFFIKCSDVKIDKSEDLQTLLKQPQDVRDAFFDCAKLISRYLYLRECRDNLDAFLELGKAGGIVEEAYPYDMSEYTDGTGVHFSFMNTSNKTIKYITINFTGYNAVGDPVRSRGKTSLTRKGIGPIESGGTGSYSFEYVWFTDIVDHLKIRSIVVQYMDGTTKTFTGESVKPAPHSIFEALDKENPVKDLLPKFEEDD